MSVSRLQAAIELFDDESELVHLLTRVQAMATGGAVGNDWLYRSSQLRSV